MLAKEQLFRLLDDVNPNPALAQIELEVMEEANRLGVGAMGFGGKVSLIGCKVTAANRLPASFFVSVAYDCWAFRRLGVRLDAATGVIKKWAVSRPGRDREAHECAGRFPVDGQGSDSHAADYGGRDTAAEGGRCCRDPRRHVYGPGCGAWRI